MGLDIYLKKCPDLAAAKAAEEQADALIEALWEGKKYETTSEADKKAIELRSAEIRAQFGIVNYAHNSVEKVERDSETAPEHMFKVGYFRSSYNEGGIDAVMRRLGLPRLREIFAYEDETYEFVPDWAASLVRCDRAIAGYEAHLASPMGKYSVSHVRPMFDRGVASEKEALDLFAGQLKQERSEDFRSFGNCDGEFWMDGMKVVAIITKKYERPRDAIHALIGGPSVFVVYEKGSDGKEDWYLTALKIVRETIQIVLAQADKQHYYLTWSG